MKKSLTRAFLILALSIAFSLNVFTQTPVSNTATVKTDETISFLLTQNENARGVIEKQKIRIADLEAEVALEKENSSSIGKSYEAAKSEIISLKQSNEALQRAVALNEQTIALLQTDNAKQKTAAKKANKAKWKARGVAAVLILLEIFRVAR